MLASLETVEFGVSEFAADVMAAASSSGHGAWGAETALRTAPLGILLVRSGGACHPGAEGEGIKDQSG